MAARQGAGLVTPHAMLLDDSLTRGFTHGYRKSYRIRCTGPR